MDLAAIRTFAKRLGGESSLGGHRLFVDADVDTLINSSMRQLWQRAKQVNSGWGHATEIIDVLADTARYPLAAGFDNRALVVKKAEPGVDFNTVPPGQGNFTEMRPTRPMTGAKSEYDRGVYTGTFFYTILKLTGDATFTLELTGAPTVAQTGGLEVTYESMPADLAVDADLPEIPASHHDLLSYMAAKELKGEIDYPWPNELEETRQRLLVAFDEDVLQMTYDPLYRAPVAGLTQYHPAAAMGRTRSIPHRRGSHRSRW